MSSRPARKTRPRVVIVGANFAGLTAAMHLDSDRYDVTVVDRSPWFEWLPNVHELLSGVKKPADLRLPRRRLLARAGHRFIEAEVTRVDARSRRVLSPTDGRVTSTHASSPSVVSTRPSACRRGASCDVVQERRRLCGDRAQARVAGALPREEIRGHRRRRARGCRGPRRDPASQWWPRSARGHRHRGGVASDARHSGEVEYERTQPLCASWRASADRHAGDVRDASPGPPRQR